MAEPFDPNFIKLNVTADPSSCDESARACTQPIDDDENPSFQESSASISIDDIDIPDLPYDTDEATTSAAIMDDNSPQIYANAGITTIQAVSMLLSWFAAFPGVSKASFTRLLTLLHDFILPSGNSLPTSYEGAIRLIKTSLSVVKDYHCCVNDCVVFRKCSTGDYEKLTKCPECNEDRYQPESNVPRKRFKYMPIETRVRRLFSNVQTSKLLQTHCTPDSEPPDTIDTIHQSKAWSSWYKSDGIFKGDCRALSFALCMDGLNPFAQEKTSYSTCPMTLVLLNFPHHIRMLAGSMILTGLIPGPKEPKKTDAYVEVLVDDVLSLNKLKLYDAYKNENFQLKANVLLHIFDYPGQNKVLHCQGIYV